MKNILFLADPNSIHDIKWISFFAEGNHAKCFLLPRISHYKTFQDSPQRNNILKEGNFRLLSPIHDFSIVRFYRTLYDASVIQKIISKNEIDVIHILYAEPNALWCLFKTFFRIPMIITTRGTDVLKTIPEAFQKKDVLNRVVASAYKRAFQLADWITTTSHAQVESVARFSQRKNQVTVIRTGVNMEKLLSNTSDFFPLHDSKRFILFPRSIKPLYNHEFGLSAIALLPWNIKKTYTMVFVGKDSDDVTYQKKLETLMCQQADVKFEFIAKQSQETIFELYKRASLVVMTPVSDGSPVSGMEALLCGAKLILGPLDYDPDIFSRAIRLKQWDVNELAQAITNALTDSGYEPPITERLKKLMDSKSNMERMKEIHRGLCNEV